MTAATITWTKDWSDVPFLDPADCPHPGSASMAIGLTIDRTQRGAARLRTDALFCMLCGIDSSGRMPPDQVLQAAWQEHGWHLSTRDRLLALAERPITEGAA